MVNEELTADLPWTSSGGKQVFVCSGPSEEGGMSNVVKTNQITLNLSKTKTSLVLEEPGFVDVRWSFFLRVTVKDTHAKKKTKSCHPATAAA